MTDLLGLGMKTQQELMQAYWGPDGTVDMVKEYNAKHGCDVQPWECVKHVNEGKFDAHPQFAGKPWNYTFALTILYDDKHKEHRPVFVGDKVYDKKIPQELEVIDSDTLQYGVLRFTDLDWDKISWNPPTPKRTFKLEFTEEEINKLSEYLVQICTVNARRLHDKLTEARDKE